MGTTAYAQDSIRFGYGARSTYSVYISCIMIFVHETVGTVATDSIIQSNHIYPTLSIQAPNHHPSKEI